MAAVIQVWSAPSCQTDAECFGALEPWQAAGGSESSGTATTLSVTVSREVADRVSLAEGRCLRVLSRSRGEQWWFVNQVRDTDGATNLVTVTAGSLRQLLTVRGFVRDEDTFAFTPGPSTIADLITAYVLTNLAADSLEWLSLGTVDSTALVEIGVLTRARRGGVLDAIETVTGETVQLRALYTAGALTGFAIDVLTDPASSLATPILAVGTQLERLDRTRDALRAATVAVPFGSDGQPMGQTAWRIDSIIGVAPAWIVLRDAVTANPWPVREDDQFIGAYLLQGDGTTTIITDARASDGAVQVAAVGTLTAGAEVSIVRDTSGNPVLELVSPSGVASSRGRLVGEVTTRATDQRRNLVQNGVFGSWTSITAPGSWTVSVGAVGEYPRATPSAASLVVDGSYAAGVSIVNFRGAQANQRFFLHEVFAFGAQEIRLLTNTLVASGTGTGTLSFAPTITNDPLVDGAAIPFFINRGPLRPASFPTEAGAGAPARLLLDSTVLQSAASTVFVGSDVVTVNLAVGLTARTRGAVGAGNLPSIQLRDTVGATTLASAAMTAMGAGTTVHTTLVCSASLASSTTVAARITAGGNTADLSGNFIVWQGVRWASLWVGDIDPAMGAQSGSGSNLLWHRAQDVLASAGQGTRYVVRGVDLALLEAQYGALVLHQLVRLRSAALGVDVTVRIVKLDYRFDAEESLNLECGTITPRLTGVTVSL